LLSQLTTWANLASTTPAELREAYGAVSMVADTRDQTRTKVKGVNDAVGDVGSHLPGVWGKAVDLVTHLFSFGLDATADTYQAYLNELIKKKLLDACEIKERNGSCELSTNPILKPRVLQ
jgi:hypothetical protein